MVVGLLTFALSEYFFLYNCVCQPIKVLYGPYLCCLVYVCFVGVAKNSQSVGTFLSKKKTKIYRESVVGLLNLVVGATGFALIIMIAFVFDFSVI